MLDGTDTTSSTVTPATTPTSSPSPSSLRKSRSRTPSRRIDNGNQGGGYLNLDIMAKVLAETLVLKGMDPPYMLGVFGGAGEGKSYFLDLMLENMIEIQKTPADDVYHRHIYAVKFDAWTFSKSNIWSSLLYQILRSLNEQLQFEEIMGKRDLENGSESTIEVFRDFTTRDVEYLLQRYEKTPDYEHVKKNGDLASERLLKAINANYEQDQKEYEDIKARIQATHAVQGMDRVLNCLGKRAVGKINLEEFKSTDIDGLIKKLHTIKSRSYYTFRVSKIPTSAMVCLFFFFILAIVLYLVFDDKVVAVAAGLLSPVIPIISSVSATIKEIDPIISNIKYQSGAAEDLEVGFFDDEDLQELKSQKKNIEDRFLVVKGHSLRDTLTTKIESKKSGSDFGIPHKIHHILQLLTDGMLRKRDDRQTGGIFPRGDPRIVLFVGGLDHCEHKYVVEVVEALQLIVSKSKLFVAVLGIDPSHLTLSFERHYQGRLNSKALTDYLEKLIQIPFRLPGIGQDYVDGYKSIFDVGESQSASKVSQLSPTKSIAGTLDTISARTDFTGSVNHGSQKADALSVSVKRTPQLEDTRLWRIDKNYYFTPEEGNMMTEIFKLSGTNPRCMQRIINVSKVLQVIWDRASDTLEVDNHLKRTTFFLILLASVESMREIVHTIFEWMEMGAATYHIVMRDAKGTAMNLNNLASLFITEMKKSDSSNGLSPSDGQEFRMTVEQATLIVYVEEYLSKYRWNRIEEWNAISSKFLLARCFSVRLIAQEAIKNKIDDTFEKVFDKSNSDRNKSFNHGRKVSQPSNIDQGRHKWNYNELNPGGGFDNNDTGGSDINDADLYQNPYQNPFNQNIPKGKSRSLDSSC